MCKSSRPFFVGGRDSSFAMPNRGPRPLHGTSTIGVRLERVLIAPYRLARATANVTVGRLSMGGGAEVGTDASSVARAGDASSAVGAIAGTTRVPGDGVARGATLWALSAHAASEARSTKASRTPLSPRRVRRSSNGSRWACRAILRTSNTFQ